jgi:hypothetical protein
MIKYFIFSVASLGLALAPSHYAEAAGFTIDTTPTWDGKNAVGAWSTPRPPGTETFGQVITTPSSPLAGVFLDDFTFFVGGSDAIFNYKAHTYQWESTGELSSGKTIGPALFESPILVLPGERSFTPVTANVGGIPLAPSTTYALFVSTIGVENLISGETTVGIQSDVYPGGKWIYSNNSFTFLGPWSGGFATPRGDLAFIANFREVPGPLPIVGAAAAFGYSRKLRKHIKSNKLPVVNAND